MGLYRNADPEIYGTVSSDLDNLAKTLLRFMKKYELVKDDLAICYEAGSTGFVLARRLLKLGYECQVIAPTSIPQSADGRIKTDRRDAKKLARLCRNGDFESVHIPDVLDEAIRDVSRARADVVNAVKDWYRKPLVDAVMGFRGIRFISGISIISELGDLRRFSHPCQLMSYIGLVPSENSSGTKRRQGGITKCGKSHVRWMLVEIIGSYRMPANVSKELSARQVGLSEEVTALSWCAQTRLCKKYYHLKRRGVHENKIKVAVARELLAFVWELGQPVEV